MIGLTIGLTLLPKRTDSRIRSWLLDIEQDRQPTTFGLDSLFIGIWLFTSKAIFIEQQQWYYLTHSWGIRGLMPFPRVLVRKNEPNSINGIWTHLRQYHCLVHQPRGHSPHWNWSILCLTSISRLWEITHLSSYGQVSRASTDQDRPKKKLSSIKIATAGETARQQLHKNAVSNFKQALEATPHKAPTVWSPTITKTIKVRWTRHAGQFWRRRD